MKKNKINNISWELHKLLLNNNLEEINKIVDNINKNTFEIILKDGPIEITPSFVLLHFQVD